MNRVVKFAGIGCGSLLLLILVLLAFLIVPLMWADFKLPQLVRFPAISRTDDFAPAFQARVRSWYPDGTSSAALESSLKDQGFHISHPPHGQIGATLEQRGFPCVIDWTVYWDQDEGGSAQGIGSYVRFGCL